jgi:hypothetical protein
MVKIVQKEEKVNRSGNNNRKPTITKQKSKKVSRKNRINKQKFQNKQ